MTYSLCRCVGDASTSSWPALARHTSSRARCAMSSPARSSRPNHRERTIASAIIWLPARSIASFAQVRRAVARSVCADISRARPWRASAVERAHADDVHTARFQFGANVLIQVSFYPACHFSFDRSLESKECNHN